MSSRLAYTPRHSRTSSPRRICCCTSNADEPRSSKSEWDMISMPRPCDVTCPIRHPTSNLWITSRGPLPVWTTPGMVPCARSLPSLVVGPQVVGGLGTSTRIGNLYPGWGPLPGLGTSDIGRQAQDVGMRSPGLLSEHSLTHTVRVMRAKPMSPEDRRQAIIRRHRLRSHHPDSMSE